MEGAGRFGRNGSAPGPQKMRKAYKAAPKQSPKGQAAPLKDARTGEALTPDLSGWTCK